MKAFPHIFDSTFVKMELLKGLLLQYELRRILPNAYHVLTSEDEVAPHPCCLVVSKHQCYLPTAILAMHHVMKLSN